VPVGPPIQGPTTLVPPGGSDGSSGGSAQNSAPSSQRVRRTSLSQRLRPYIDDASASELLYPNKADRPWKYIVLHHSATPGGNYDQIDVEHRKVLGFDGCGYHFVIGNGTGSGDGQIEVAQRWTNQKQGVHCRNARSHDVDEYGIGICLVGDLDQSPPTQRQIAAAQALIAYLSQRYAISQDRIASHTRVASTTTVCPGKYFPTEAILSLNRDANATRHVPTTWRVVHDSRTSY
jgi:N-acetyl-anhydromuramyl-L-alanine amidase AmpD